MNSRKNLENKEKYGKKEVMIMKKIKLAKRITSAAVLATLTLGLAACGSTNDVDKNSSNGSNTAGESVNVEEKKTLTVGVVNLPDEPINPALTTVTWSDLGAPVFDALITQDGNGNYAPGLADSWELADDKKQFTLHLKEGVKFHDGSAFDSEDVKFTLEYYAGDTSNQGDKNLLVKYLDSIDTPDAQTVVLNFTEPVAEFEYLLSSNGTGIGLVLPSDYFEKVGEEEFGKHPIGTGPFVFDSYSAGEQITYHKNQEYWGEQPNYDTLIVKQYGEESTRTAALQAGEIDFAPISSNSVPVVDGVGGVRVEKADYSTTLGLFISGTYQDNGEATQNADVRKALSLAINRQEIVDTIFDGNAVAAGVWGLFPFTYGYDGSHDAVAEYNPEKAKELLAKAGYPDAFKNPSVKFYLVNSAEYTEDVAQAIVGYWKEIGVDTTIIQTDRVELNSLRTEEPVSEAFAGAVYFFEPPKKYSSYDAFAPFFPSTSRIHLTKDNKVVDEGVAAIISLQGEEREAKVNEVLAALDSEIVDIPLVYPGSYYAVSDKVESVNYQASGHVSRWYAQIKVK